MKRLSIADIKASDILSKEEKINAVGGGSFNCFAMFGETRVDLGRVEARDQAAATRLAYNTLDKSLDGEYDNIVTFLTCN
jgi:hypothetical protein